MDLGELEVLVHLDRLVCFLNRLERKKKKINYFLELNSSVI